MGSAQRRSFGAGGARVGIAGGSWPAARRGSGAAALNGEYTRPRARGQLNLGVVAHRPARDRAPRAPRRPLREGRQRSAGPPRLQGTAGGDPAAARRGRALNEGPSPGRMRSTVLRGRTHHAPAGAGVLWAGSNEISRSKPQAGTWSVILTTFNRAPGSPGGPGASPPPERAATGVTSRSLIGAARVRRSCVPVCDCFTLATRGIADVTRAFVAEVCRCSGDPSPVAPASARGYWTNHASPFAR